jgi:high-affinity nickel permease
MTPSTILLLGLLLGLKHALDSDHLIAVSTIVSRERSPWRSLWIGLSWGVGHTVTLLLVGVLVLVMNIHIPPSVELSLECVVGLVLLGLGVSTLYDSWKQRLHVHAHAHAGSVHAHFHTHAATAAHYHLHLMRVGMKPLLIGMVHGLAGSAALMLLVLATIPSLPLGLLYIGIFGCGSVVGMGLMSFLLGVFFSLATERLHALDHKLRMAVGTLSATFGAWMVVEIGFVQGLFLS